MSTSKLWTATKPEWQAPTQCCAQFWVELCTLFNTKSLDGVDGGGATSGNHARNASSNNQNDDSYGHDAEVNTRDFVELCLYVADAEHSDGRTNDETE